MFVFWGLRDGTEGFLLLSPCLVCTLQDCQVVSAMVQPRLLTILSEHLYYDEIAIPFTRMQNECKQLIALLADSNIDLQERFNCSVFTIDQANELVGPASHSNMK